MTTAVQIVFETKGVKDVDGAIASIGKSLDKLARTGQSAAERSVRARISGEESVARAAERASKAQLRQAERAARDEAAIRNKINALEVRDYNKSEREKTRALEQASRERERIAKREVDTIARDHDRRARTFGRSVGGATSRAFGTAGRIAATVGAIGGGFAIADSLGRGISQEATAGQIVRSSATTGGLGTGDVLNAARAGAMTGSTTMENSLGGLDTFVKKTGDLKMGVDLMQDMAKWSASSGASMEDLGSAMAEVVNQIGDLDQSKQAMRVLIGQGKAGAIDIRDLAQYGARVTALSNTFEGAPAQNVATFGAIAQLAKSKGGAIDAAGATESVAALFGEMASHQKDFAGMGVQLRGKGGKLRPIEDILTETIDKEKGDPLKLEHLFGRRASSAVLGLSRAYNEAGGGTAGQAAVRGALAAGRGQEVTQAQLDADTAKKGTEIQAQLNTAMLNLDKALLPLLTRLPELVVGFTAFIPQIEKAVKIFAEFPKLSIGAVIGAAVVADIAKAGIGNAVSAAILALLKGRGGGGGGGGVPVPGGGGGVPRALALVGAGAAGFGIGTAIGQEVIDPILNAGEKGRRGADIAAMNVDSVTAAVRAGRISPEKAKEMLGQARTMVNQTKEAGSAGNIGSALLGSLTGAQPGVGRMNEAREFSAKAEGAGGLLQALDALSKAIDQKASAIAAIGMPDSLANPNHPARGGVQ